MNYWLMQIIFMNNKWINCFMSFMLFMVKTKSQESGGKMVQHVYAVSVSNS